MNTTASLKVLTKILFNKLGYTITRSTERRFPYTTAQSFENGGPTFLFWIANLLGEHLYTIPWIGDPEYHGIKELISANGIKRVLEVGTHHGKYTLAIANLVGKGGSVIGYEADPMSVLIAQANMALNSVSNVKIIGKAIGAKRGKFTYNRSSMAGAVGIFKKSYNPELLQIPMVTLDEEIEGPVDMLKIDVEGFEGQVLKGCQRLLEKRPCLALEIHMPFLASYKTSFEQIAQLAHLNDYEGIIYDNKFVNIEHLRKWDGIESTTRDFVIHLFLSPKKI